MNLPLDISVPPGRKMKQPLHAEVKRELGESDLAALEATVGETKAPPIKRLSSRHHSLARLLAAGMTPGEATAVTGYTPSRISILQTDPSFKELVAFYKREVDGMFEDIHDRLVGLSTDALELLRERMEDNPEEFTVGQVMEVLKLGTDRIGHGPQTKADHNHHHTVDVADRLEKARKRLADQRSREAEDAEVINDADD